MTGQDAVNVAASFNEKVGIDGVILTLKICEAMDCRLEDIMETIKD